MLVEATRQALEREAFKKRRTFNLDAHRVRQFEALCAVFREQCIEFTEHLVVEENAIQYHITPHHYGDYLAIIESTRLMEARRTPSPNAALLGYDLIDPTPDAPAFWLNTVTSADVYKSEETQRE